MRLQNESAVTKRWTQANNANADKVILSQSAEELKLSVTLAAFSAGCGWRKNAKIVKS